MNGPQCSLFVFFLLFSLGCHLKGKSSRNPARPQGFHEDPGIPCMHCHGSAMPEKDHDGRRPCAECHDHESWRGAHFFHDPMPESCHSCHEPSRKENHYGEQDCQGCHRFNPEAIAPFFFDHMNAKSTEIESCQNCHLAEKPLLRHTEDEVDCHSCHNTSHWLEARFRHWPTPASCEACHQGSRPEVFEIPIPLSKVSAGHYDDEDCGICHRYENSLILFRFQHDDAAGMELKTCLPCHYERAMAVRRPRHSRFRPRLFNNCQGCHPFHYSWESE